jgi:hypothetical protein
MSDRNRDLIAVIAGVLTLAAIIAAFSLLGS